MRLTNIAAVGLLSAAGGIAFGQFGGVFVCANCADEPTAASIKIMHDLEYAKQLLQYAIQVQQLADAIKNSVHRGPESLTNVGVDLNLLANVVQGGRSLAYSLGNQDAVFRQTFPGYQPVFGPSPATGTFQNKYAMWAETSLASTQGILRGVGVQGRLLATEQGILSVLRELTASNILNRNDAINLTGQLAAEQVAQLHKLRELQLEDMTSKAAYQGYVIQRQAASEPATQWYFSSGPASSDGRGFWPGLR
jgi:type IV secretion system protein TrbJ